MFFNDKKLLFLENKLTVLLTDLFYQTFIVNKHYSKLQMMAYLKKNKYITQYYNNVSQLAVLDTVNYVGKERFPLYGAKDDDTEIIDYMIPYILFFMENSYEHMMYIHNKKNIPIEEVFKNVEKNRLSIFVAESVNILYNKSIIQTSKIANVEHFRFVAVIDARTSFLCRSLNQKIIDVHQIEYYTPPLHPHCRSHIEPVIEKFNKKQLFTGDLRPGDAKRLSWYRKEFSFLNKLNVNKIISMYI